MKKQKIILILTILTLLIIMTLTQGCTDRRTEPINFYRGSSGVEIDFLNNAPPRYVTENTIVSVMIDIWNKGAYTVPNTETTINLRYDPVYFSLNTEDDDFFLTRNPDGQLGEISGKSETWPQGESFVMPFAQLNVQEIPGTRESPTTNLELTICYPYKTYISEMICLDTDIYGVDTNPLCRNRERYTYSNQGAPIAINKLEVDMLPVGFVETTPGEPAHVPLINQTGELIGIAPQTTTERLVLIEPVIRIYARNIGQGDVFIPNEENIDTTNLCSFRDETFQFREHNKIKLTKAKLDGFEMNCEKKILNLANPSDFVTCRLHANQTGYLRQNIEVPFSAEFEYYYRDSTTKQIQIQRQS